VLRIYYTAYVSDDRVHLLPHPKSILNYILIVIYIYLCLQSYIYIYAHEIKNSKCHLAFKLINIHKAQQVSAIYGYLVGI
jgi:hypothetical protein